MRESRSATKHIVSIGLSAIYRSSAHGDVGVSIEHGTAPSAANIIVSQDVSIPARALTGLAVATRGSGRSPRQPVPPQWERPAVVKTTARVRHWRPRPHQYCDEIVRPIARMGSKRGDMERISRLSAAPPCAVGSNTSAGERGFITKFIHGIACGELCSLTAQIRKSKSGNLLGNLRWQCGAQVGGRVDVGQ